MPEFLFVRHGQSEANAAGIVADASPSLTDVGFDQARKAAAGLRDLSIATVLCSPYLRAYQTAETIADELGVASNIQVADDLRERGLGVLEGQPQSRELMWYYSGNDAEGVETTLELYGRMGRCLEGIREMALQMPNQQRILAVGHTVSGFYLRQVAAQKPFDGLDAPSRMGNAQFVSIPLL